MGLPRYAAKTDDNQQEIVKALRAIGCKVEIIGRPVDLLIGYRGLNFLLECKPERRQNRSDQKKQRDWIKAWRGQVCVVTSAEQAIKAVTT